MPGPRRKLGDRGEDVALNYLKNQGYEILDRNWQRKWGEIDIVARENNEIVFLEVKTQSQGDEK